MPLTPQDLNALVKAELDKITDAAIAQKLKALLVPPTSKPRKWSPGEDAYPCWTVAEHKASDTALVYTTENGTRCPWGAVSIKKKWFGIDCAWSSRLEDAYCESAAASELKIWRVVKRGEKIEEVAGELRLADAFAECDKRNKGSAKPIYAVERSRRQPAETAAR